IEEVAEKEPGLVVFNSDPDAVNASPLQRAGSIDMTPQKGAVNDNVMKPETEDLLSQYALLATLAAPGLRERNLNSLWNESLSGSGVVSRGRDGLEDESLAMAENKSKSGVAVTTVTVR